jgi:APA family basic amino acid/polyamine antiporter
VNTLKRQIGLKSATALIIGEVIAVGIFLTPAGMAKSLGSPLWLLVVWMVMAGMALCGALCYGELAARYPEAGGGYVYLREAYGPGLAFLYGWKSLLVMDPGIIAALAVGFSSYADYLLGVGSFGRKALAIGAIAVIALINIAGVRVGAGLLRFLVVVKLGALAAIITWAIATRAGNLDHFTPFAAQRAGSEPLGAALAAALVGAFFAFGGWWDLGKLAGEVRQPERNVPLALVLGVTAVALVYIATSAVFVYLVPMESVVSGETFAAQAGEVLFGKAGGAIFSVVVIVSILGSLCALLMSAPRVYFAMARDGLFLERVAELHPRYGTPARATIVVAVLASILVLAGTFNQIVGYFVFVTVCFIAITVAGLSVLRRRQAPPGAFRVPGYPLTPAIFLMMVLLLLILIAGNNPRQAFLGVGVMLLGIPVYYLLQKGRNNGLDTDSTSGGSGRKTAKGA